MIQLGGYSKDPLGIWKVDEVSKTHGMDEWIERLATPDKKGADLAMYKALEDKKAQLSSRMKQWNITMDPLWMAQYEDPEVIQLRLSLRPTGAKAGAHTE
jgi:hypothetical protein